MDFDRTCPMHAAIVAGGLGTRAVAMISNRTPKALLPVGGVPIIVRQMRVLRREGVTRISVLGGHLGNQLQQVLAPEATALGLSLEIIVEEAALGTAGCLTGLHPVSNGLLIVYGDILFDLTLAPLYEFHRWQNALLTVVAHPNDHPRTSDLIVEEDGIVKEILPLGQPRRGDCRNLVPAGIYLAGPTFISNIKRGIKADMIRDVLPALIAAGARIAAYKTTEYLRDIGTPARHKLAERDLAAGRVEVMHSVNHRPAIFFDCDGVLNHERGLHGALTPDDVIIMPEAGSAVRRAREAGQLTIAVTNRSQVAKGLVTFNGLAHILGRLEALLAEDGGVLDRIYYCPHHPESGFPGEIPSLKVHCECRKPGTLLLRRAFADLPIDKRRSALIGDSVRDIGAAHGVGIWAYGVRTGHGCRDRELHLPAIPDLMFNDASEAVSFQIEYRTIAAPIVANIRKLIDAQPAPLLIGVCGRSRAGKSVVAHAIVRTLVEDNIACLHVRLDNWIVPADRRGSCASAEARNRVDAMPDLVRTLLAGTCVRAPGYDAAARGSGQAITYDPNGQSIIVLDGIFAAHPSIRKMLNLVVFAGIPLDLQRERFLAFYRWKGLDEGAIDLLWNERISDEWPVVDAQRDSADFVMTSGVVNS
jgi:histidinol-phosphate phosphatase family protein